MKLSKICLVTLAIAICQLTYGQKVTYIANEGVLIENNGKKILIDALFDQFDPKFGAPSDDELQKIINGKAPYDNVTLALSTHSHRDHFNGSIAAKYLHLNKSTILICTNQAGDTMNLKSNDYETVMSRVISYPWKKGWKTYTQEGITVKSSYFIHAGKMNFNEQNQVYLISMDNKKIFHLGDTEMDLGNFDGQRFQYENIDVAFIPFWYMTSLYGAELVKKYIAPKQIVVVHMPVSGADKFIEKIKSFSPEAIIFTESGQTVTF